MLSATNTQLAKFKSDADKMNGINKRKFAAFSPEDRKTKTESTLSSKMLNDLQGVTLN